MYYTNTINNVLIHVTNVLASLRYNAGGNYPVVFWAQQNKKSTDQMELLRRMITGIVHLAFSVIQLRRHQQNMFC